MNILLLGPDKSGRKHFQGWRLSPRQRLSHNLADNYDTEWLAGDRVTSRQPALPESSSSGGCSDQGGSALPTFKCPHGFHQHQDQTGK